VSLESLAQKPLGGREVTPFAEPELDRIAVAVDRPVKIHPTTSDLDVSFIDVPLACDDPLASIEALQKFG
jgi:hypothetical protein